MNIDFKNLKMKHTVDLTEYHESLEGGSVDVWINPNQDFYDAWLDHNCLIGDQNKRFEQFTELEKNDDKAAALISEIESNTKLINESAFGLYAQLWFMPVEAVRDLYQAQETIGVYRWLTTKTWELIRYYKAGRKNA